MTYDSTLCVYYRYNSGQSETTCFRQLSTKGITWSRPEKLFTVDRSGTFASPTLVRSGKADHMYFVDTITERVKVHTSNDGANWGQSVDVLWFAGAWHLDAIKVEDWLYLMINAQNTLFLLRSTDNSNWFLLTENGWEQYFCYSRLQSRLDALPIVLPSETGWDNDSIYRSTFLIEEGVLKLWYGARSKVNEWNVGYTFGTIP